MLPRKNRVRTSSFRNPMGPGRSFFVEEITLKVSKNGLVEPPQCAVIVSKKMANTAVLRNTIRRRVYSALVPVAPKLPEGYRFYFYPKKEVLKLPFSSLKKVVFEVLSKTNLL